MNMSHPSDKTAFANAELVFRQYYGRLCYFAFKFLNDRTLAEDIAQDAFVAYWNNRMNVSDDPKAIKDYLYSAIKNSCLNISRRKKVMDKYLNSRSEEDFKEEKLIHTIIESEIIESLYLAINALPDSCRKVFRLGYLEGLSNAKIAEQLNISINTVRAQKQRGLKALRLKLDVETFIAFVILLST